MSYLVNFLGGKKRYPDGHPFIQTNSVTVADTVTETQLTGTGIGSVSLPANLFIPGRTIEVIARGFESKTSGNIHLRLRYGGVSGTVLMDTGSVTGTGYTNAGWIFRCLITCRTTGASGTVIGQGEYHELENNNTFGTINTSPITIDTTTTNDLVLTAQWSIANPGNTITATNIVYRIIS